MIICSLSISLILIISWYLQVVHSLLHLTYVPLHFFCGDQLVFFLQFYLLFDLRCLYCHGNISLLFRHIEILFNRSLL